MRDRGSGHCTTPAVMPARPSKRRWLRASVVIILACHTVALAWLGYVEAPVWHEPAQLTAGLCWWSFGRSDASRVNPPFVRLLAAAPVLLLHPLLDPSEFDRPPDGRDEFARAERFLRANSAELRQYFALSRWACISFSLVGAYYSWRFAKSLYGMWAGLISLILWCSCPYIIGHGATVMADVPAAALGVTAVYYFWLWLRSPDWSLTIVVGAVLGIAMLCKLTLFILYLMFPAIWIFYGLSDWRSTARRAWRWQGTQLVVIILVSIFVINCGYLWEGTFTPLKEFQFQSMMFGSRISADDISRKTDTGPVPAFIGEIPIPLPADLIRGLDAQRYDFERGLPSYLRSTWSNYGWWYYYLYAMAIKIPLGTWCLVALAVAVTVLRKGYSARRREEMVVFVPGLVILIFVSSQTGFSVHSRYVIPALPFLFVWTSKVGQVFEMRPFTKKRMVMATMVIAASIWSLGSSLAIYPHSLSYFNELAAVLSTPGTPPRSGLENRGIWAQIKNAMLAGPRNGPRHLLDSNIDWGQDLFFLKDWLDTHPETALDGLAYYNSYSATLVGIREIPYPPTEPETTRYDSHQPQGWVAPKPGWYALSVNYLYDRSGQYRYFRYFEPVAMAGYSIYIYHITQEEANRVRRGMNLPELPMQTSVGP